MKKDRNCGMNMPIYPNYPMPNMMPGVPQMNGVPYMENNYGFSYPDSDSISSLKSQISSLERRISNLEGLVGSNNTTYNTTNYQML